MTVHTPTRRPTQHIRRDENVAILKKIALPIAFEYVVSLVFCAKDEKVSLINRRDVAWGVAKAIGLVCFTIYMMKSNGDDCCSTIKADHTSVLKLLSSEIEPPTITWRGLGANIVATSQRVNSLVLFNPVRHVAYAYLPTQSF